MRPKTTLFGVCLMMPLVISCASTPDSRVADVHEHESVSKTTTMPVSNVVPEVIQTAYSEKEWRDETLPLPETDDAESMARVPQATAATIGLPELIDLTLERNPRLEQVTWVVEAARGRALQAGLYPNPTVSITGNEIGDRTGPDGIWSAFASQEIVTANKRDLSQAVALRGVDQAALGVMVERYRLFTEVRQAFFEAVTLQQRADILDGLLALAEQSVENSNRLVQAKEAAELDVVQLEVDLERYRADLEATQRALPGAYRRLAASVGVTDMAIDRLVGDLNTPLPDYDLDDVRFYVLGVHPELRSAQIGVDRARLALRRAEVQPIPNVTIGSGYTYQGQNRSSDWDIGVSVPLPVWDKNQGNIREAHAQLHQALTQVGRVENELVDRLASAFSTYSSARQRAERYKTSILPRAQRTYELSQRAYQGGQFEYLRVLQSQRAVAEANLELVRSLGEMWQSASEIAGLMLEDQWPLAHTESLPERNES